MSTLERAAPSRTVIHLVPHTHWDREWYEPFQSFRMRLVELVDELLAQMRDDPQFRFTLDGQRVDTGPEIMTFLGTWGTEHGFAGAHSSSRRAAITY